jgi:hypothetical protein
VTVKSVNLIPAPRRDAKRRRRHRNACLAVCGAYASLLAGAVGVAHVALTGTGRTLDQQLASAESEVQRIEQAAAHSRRELASARATIEANRTVAEQPDWSVLLALLAKTTSDDVILRGVTIGPPPAQPRGARRPRRRTRCWKSWASGEHSWPSRVTSCGWSRRACSQR